MNTRQYFVDIMTNKKNGMLYIGVTNNLSRRTYGHRHRLMESFTMKYGIDRLVCYETFNDVRLAIAREKQPKGWLRMRKLVLIESKNPTWNDLAESI